MDSAQDTWDALICEVDHRGARRWRDENGKLHRDNGPAVIYADGTRFWYRHGKCHRDDGPAIIHHSGTRHWFKHGALHREDGPAVIYDSGEVEYWIDDECLTEEQFNALKTSNVS